MKFVIQHGVGDPSSVPAILAPDAMRRFCRAAEAGGFGALAFTDHPAPSVRWADSGGEGVADPISSLGFCAAVTTNIRLLTYVLVLPYRNPFVSAQCLSTLDVLSDGRVIAGLGTGYLRGEFRALGAPMEERRDRFDEYLDVMLRAWAGDVEHLGSSFDAPGTRVGPKPIQQPHPPIWIHANTAWGTRRAARHAQGCLFMMSGPEQSRTTRTAHLAGIDALGPAIDRLHLEAEAAGRSPSDIEVVVSGSLPMLDIRRGWDTDAYLRDVERLSQLGVDWLALNACGDDPTVAEETVAAFGQSVVQELAG